MAQFHLAIKGSYALSQHLLTTTACSNGTRSIDIPSPITAGSAGKLDTSKNRLILA